MKQHEATLKGEVKGGSCSPRTTERRTLTAREKKREKKMKRKTNSKLLEEGERAHHFRVSVAIREECMQVWFFFLVFCFFEEKGFARVSERRRLEFNTLSEMFARVA